MPKTLVTLALGEETTAKARTAWETCAPRIDLVELRLDLMREYDLPALLRDRPTPAIVTNRPEREGGRSTMSDRERVRVLLQAAELGVEHVDCELDSIHWLTREALGSTKLIVSSHDFEQTPADFRERHRRIEDTACDIAKIVGTARRSGDTALALDLMRTARKPVIAITMGERGLPSRILAPRFGAYLTFVAKDQGTAPGQLDLDTMHRVYRVREIDPNTEMHGYIYEGTVPDLEPVNAAFRAEGRNAVAVPLPADGETPQQVWHAYASAGFARFVQATAEVAPE